MNKKTQFFSYQTQQVFAYNGEATHLLLLTFSTVAHQGSVFGGMINV